MTLRLGWFTTARGPGSRAMFDAVTRAIAEGAIDARISVVFSNREPGEDPVTDGFFARVRELGIALVTRSSVKFRRTASGELSRPGAPLPDWRIAYDRAVYDALARHRFDLGVMAGYMLIFEREFVARHSLLNLHPALPGGPAGTWQEVIRALIREHALVSGVMLHVAVADVDAGPLVAYTRYPIRGAAFDDHWAALASHLPDADDAALEASELFALIRAAGVARESPLLVATLGALAARRLRIEAGAVLDASGKPSPPLDLTAEVEALVTPASG